MTKMMDKMRSIPVILFSALVPLIMFARKIDITGQLFKVYNGSSIHIDFFSFYKMFFILIAFVFAIIITVFYSLNNKEEVIEKISEHKIYILLLLIFSLLIFLSGVFSNYKFISFFGLADRFEGMFVFLSYAFFTIYVLLFIEKDNLIRYILKGIIISSSIIGFIGLLEYFGLNPLKTNLGRHLILPVSMWDIADRIKFSISNGSIASTLYNPNFVGSYMVMTFFLGWSRLVSSENFKSKILWFLYALLMMFNLIGCQSAAGKVGFIFGVVLLIIIYRKKLLSIKGIYLLVFLSIFFMLPGLLNMNSGVISEIASQKKSLDEDFIEKKMLDSNFDINVTEDVFSTKFTNNGGVETLDIQLTKGKFKILYNGLPLDIRMDKNNNIVVNDEVINEFFDMKISSGNQAMILSYKSRFAVILKFTKKGIELLDTYGRPIVKFKDFEEFKFLEGKEFLGSSRGYIWKMSIPLIKDNILLGSGSDAFAAVYPQNDLVGKFKYLYGSSKYVDKPHNMYIQMAIQTGILSMILYMILLVVYGLDTLKIYLANKNDSSDINLGIGLFLAVFSFSISGFFNDSNVCVSPLYWTILGMGILINKDNKKDKGESNGY